LPALVWNMKTGPRVPRASKFSATATSLRQRCWLTKAAAPVMPVSSTSNSKMMSFFSFGPAFSARAVSSSTPTAWPSSAAPGPSRTES
jgi:hypothetical protein